jgi:hypothetical protein
MERISIGNSIPELTMKSQRQWDIRDFVVQVSERHFQKSIRVMDNHESEIVKEPFGQMHEYVNRSLARAPKTQFRKEKTLLETL